MNDFTKKELQILSIELNINFNRAKSRKLTVPKVMMDLINKIQSMIVLYDCQVVEAWHCEKCGHVQ